MVETREISELSSVIGELRNFAAQQTVTNSHMLEELKKIGEKISGLGEMGATFVEYRRTNHERWGRVHENLGELDERLDRLEVDMKRTNDTIIAWKAQLRSLIWVGWITCTLISSLLSIYGGWIIRSLAAHTP
jgi:hypothetical protein